MKKFLKIMIVMLVVSVLMVFYMIKIEPKLLVVNEQAISSYKQLTRPFKVIQFTDTQIGEFYSLEDLEKVKDRINTLNPDIVCFTGDLLDHANQYNQKAEVVKILSQIKAKYGKYAIFGNHDHGGGGIRCYETMMTEAGFMVLKNSNEMIDIEGQIINIVGIDDMLIGKPDRNKVKGLFHKEDYNIFLIHEPDYIDEFKELPVDLALSGHSHGGQVRLPLVGALASNKGAKKYSKGLYPLNFSQNGNLFVSSGLGNTKLPFRFGNIPEVVEITIR